MAALEILLASAHSPAAKPLASALSGQGARVTLINAEAFADRAAAHAAFSREPRADAVVIMMLPPTVARTPRRLVDMDEAGWAAVTDAPLRGALFALQGARRHFDGVRGSIICVGPDVGLSGASECAALATLAEGQRGLMKSAARQWGATGLSINWISVATTLIAPDLIAASFPELPELGPDTPASGRTPGLDQLATTIAYLAGAGADAHCGASFNLDGGRWMLP